MVTTHGRRMLLSGGVEMNMCSLEAGEGMCTDSACVGDDVMVKYQCLEKTVNKHKYVW